MSPLAIDIGCGKGGWTRGLLAAGFRVVGFDLQAFAEYPGELVIQDLRTLHGSQFRHAQLLVASPPCTQFSKSHMKMFWPDAPFPAEGVELFRHCERIGKESGIPYVIENVIGAQKFVGRAVNHCGPFYLWGTGVPAIMPNEAYAVKGKGFKIERDPQTGKRELGGGRRFSSRSPLRKDWSATVAMIPEELSRYIGEVYAK